VKPKTAPHRTIPPHTPLKRERLYCRELNVNPFKTHRAAGKPFFKNKINQIQIKSDERLPARAESATSPASALLRLSTTSTNVAPELIIG